MSEQEAIARAREREAEIVRIRAAKKLQAALRNKKIGQNYQNQLNLNKANAEAAAQQEEMARQAAKENSNQQNQEYIKSRQNEYRRIKAANTLSNAWLNRQAIHQFADEYANREQEKRQAANILKKAARRQVYNTGWAQVLPGQEQAGGGPPGLLRLRVASRSATRLGTLRPRGASPAHVGCLHRQNGVWCGVNLF